MQTNNTSAEDGPVGNRLLRKGEQEGCQRGTLSRYGQGTGGAREGRHRGRGRASQEPVGDVADGFVSLELGKATTGDLDEVMAKNAKSP